MDTMLARYLDGDLTEHEAQVLRTMLATNRALAAELRELETAIGLFSATDCSRPAGDFTARVMAALPAAAPGRTRAAGRPGRAWALAASLVLCLLAGWTAGRILPREPRTSGALLAAAPAPALPVRWVRLVHVPEGPDVRQVAVAGDFNGWNAAATPMTRQGAAWVAWLALPADVYEYQFVENGGERWLADPLAVQTRDDGFGGRNAVLDLGL